MLTYFEKQRHDVMVDTTQCTLTNILIDGYQWQGLHIIKVTGYNTTRHYVPRNIVDWSVPVVHTHIVGHQQ